MPLALFWGYVSPFPLKFRSKLTPVFCVFTTHNFCTIGKFLKALEAIHEIVCPGHQAAPFAEFLPRREVLFSNMFPGHFTGVRNVWDFKHGQLPHSFDSFRIGITGPSILVLLNACFPIVSHRRYVCLALPYRPAVLNPALPCHGLLCKRRVKHGESRDTSNFNHRGHMITPIDVSFRL